jgi:hypothetical protein
LEKTLLLSIYKTLTIIKKTMLKTTILFLFTFLSFTSFSQWTVCTAPGSIDNITGYYFDNADGCWKLCPSGGAGSFCDPNLPVSVPADVPIICAETPFENNTMDVIKIYYDYQLACNSYTIPGLPPVDQMITPGGCMQFTCAGFVVDDACFNGGPYDNYILQGNMMSPKINVAYKLKDQCSVGGDGGTTTGSSCECPTLGIDIGGVYYSLAGSSITTGATIVTAIPVTGGTLGINNIGGIVHFVIL